MRHSSRQADIVIVTTRVVCKLRFERNRDRARNASLTILVARVEWDRGRRVQESLVCGVGERDQRLSVKLAPLSLAAGARGVFALTLTSTSSRSALLTNIHTSATMLLKSFTKFATVRVERPWFEDRLSVALPTDTEGAAVSIVALELKLLKNRLDSGMVPIPVVARPFKDRLVTPLRGHQGDVETVRKHYLQVSHVIVLRLARNWVLSVHSPKWASPGAWNAEPDKRTTVRKTMQK